MSQKPERPEVDLAAAFEQVFGVSLQPTPWDEMEQRRQDAAESGAYNPKLDRGGRRRG